MVTLNPLVLVLLFLLTGCGTLITYHVNLENPIFAPLDDAEISKNSEKVKLRLSLRQVVDARPDPTIVGKLPGPYGAAFGKIMFTPETVLTDRLTKHVEAAVRAAGYGVVPLSSESQPVKTTSPQGLLDVTIRDLTVEQFQEIFPSTMRVEARMLIETILVHPVTGKILWTHIFRGSAVREHILIFPRAHWEPALNEAYAECLQQLEQTLASSGVQDLLTSNIEG